MAPIAPQIDVGSGKGLRCALQVAVMRTMRMGYSSVLLRSVCLLPSGLWQSCPLPDQWLSVRCIWHVAVRYRSGASQLSSDDDS